jgi:hypothetical protein
MTELASAPAKPVTPFWEFMAKTKSRLGHASKAHAQASSITCGKIATGENCKSRMEVYQGTGRDGVGPCTWSCRLFPAVVLNALSLRYGSDVGNGFGMLAEDLRLLL